MDGGTDDRELVERVALGDESAFAAVYDRHAGLVYGSVVRFLGDREAAAEVVQDAFVALWRRADSFDARAGTLASWLVGIARNRAIDRFRAEGRRPQLERLHRDGEAGTGDDSRERRMIATETAPDPAGIVTRRWTQSVVRTVVAELPEAEREVVLLAYGRGLSQSEIADRMGSPIGTVKSRTRRAMARLRTRLAAVPGVVDQPASVEQ